MTDTTENPTVETDVVEPIEQDVEQIDTPDDVEAQEPEQDVEQEPETFPRAYVEKLREEAAEARVKAKDRDELARRLHTALVAADGRLVAADELEFDEAHLDDAEALSEAITHLVERKPYLAARRLRGDVGQGQRRAAEEVDIAGILRAMA